MRTFEEELPLGYKAVKIIDCKDKKMEFYMIVGNLLIMAATVVLLLLIHPISWNISLFDECYEHYLLFVIVMIAHIICHELLHGIAYWFTTRQKLTFGMTLTVAYCGVPNIYVYRRTALISLFAPLTVFTIVFGLVLLFCNNDVTYLFTAFMMGLHLGGCIGDMTVIWLLLRKYKDGTVLVKDTGPKQEIYTK